MKKIIVPIDFSNETDRVIEKAMQMAKALSSTVYLVHVKPPIKGCSGGDDLPIEE